VVVDDASADSHGTNAMYEATTTKTAGAAVTWAYLAKFATPGGAAQKTRKLYLATNVSAVISSAPVVSDAVYAAYTENAAMVEVYVNGMQEKDFTINSSKEFSLTGYTADGWTSADAVDIYYYGAA
jgi:hypothetical protein